MKIVQFLEKLKEDRSALYKNIMEMVVYSEGKLSYTEAWNLSMEERTLFVEVLTAFSKAKSGNDAEENEYL